MRLIWCMVFQLLWNALGDVQQGSEVQEEFFARVLRWHCPCFGCAATLWPLGNGSCQYVDGSEFCYSARCLLLTSLCGWA